MTKNQSQGPGTRNNPQGIPQEGHGRLNTRGASGNPQNTNTKGSGAQKLQQQKKR